MSEAPADPLGIFRSDLFAGRTAVVTGGGTGLGFAIARAFAARGANLVIASRNSEHLDPAREKLEQAGAECLAVETNIREADQVENLLERSIERFGRVDYLINNAGGQFPARPGDISDRGWRSVVDLNLNGTWNMCSRFGPHMVERKSGSIVNIVHIYSYDRGAPDWVHSGAARAGVVNMTKTLAYHWARHGVTVNALAPGMIDTTAIYEKEFAYAEADDYTQIALGDIPARRFGTPDEVAAITLFLCSAAARFINGTSVVADGASYMATWTDFLPPRDSVQ
ncbi:MAG: SDR family oxidoreductase [Acidobacteriota bacterium]|nr:SDR family oxidoreductase [Acidobacteriota bacterium]